MGAMMAQTAWCTAALLAVGDDMMVLCCDGQRRSVERWQEGEIGGLLVSRW
jgi:hypothetical protein